MVGALAQYLDCPESIPLSQRMTEVERKVAELERLEIQVSQLLKQI